MPLLLPKWVEISNLKLRLLYYSIQIIAITLVLVRFAVTEQYAKRLLMAPYMAGEMWVNPVETGLLQELWQERSASNTCVNARLMDFQLDQAGNWSYTNHSCYPPCPGLISTSDLQQSVAHMAESGCLRIQDMVRRESQSQVLFVTQFEERQQSGAADDGVRMAFVTFEEAFSVSFAYRYSLEQPSPWGDYVDTPMPRVSGSSSSGVLTVVQRADLSVAYVIEPGRPSIKLEVTELLEFAGIPNFLDTPNPDTGRNYREGTETPQGGLGRITGLNIDLNVECHQGHIGSIELPDGPGRSWKGPVCYVRVEQSPVTTWASAELETFGHMGEPLRRTQHGIRVAFVFGGSFKFFDLEFLILQITSSIVFLFLPQKLIFLFVCNFLGHLSAIYRDAVIEKFSVGKEIARITSRILSTSVTFVELEEATEADADASSSGDRPAKGNMEGHISKWRLDAFMREVLKSRNAILEDCELRAMVNFCYDSLLSINSFSGKGLTRAQTFKNDINEILDMQRGESRLQNGLNGNNQRIDIDCFSMCSASSPTMDFDSFVKLFDASRNMQLLERAFTPQYLANLTSFDKGLTDADGSLRDPSEPDPEDRDGIVNHKELVRQKKQDLNVLRGAGLESKAREVAHRMEKLEMTLGLGNSQGKTMDGYVLEMKHEIQTRIDEVERRLHSRIEALIVGGPAVVASPRLSTDESEVSAGTISAGNCEPRLSLEKSEGSAGTIDARGAPSSGSMPRLALGKGADGTRQPDVWDIEKRLTLVEAHFAVARLQLSAKVSGDSLERSSSRSSSPREVKDMSTADEILNDVKLKLPQWASTVFFDAGKPNNSRGDASGERQLSV